MNQEHSFVPLMMRCALVSLLLFAHSLAAAAEPESRASPVRAEPVRIDTVANEVTAVGSLRAEESVMIRPEIAGRILSVYLAEGQPVFKRAVLITIDPAEYRAQLAASTAEVNLNRLTLERDKELNRKKLISRQQYDESKAKLDESVARQSLDQVRLSRTVIHAPFDGVLGLRLVSPGAYVQPGQDIVRLENIATIKLDLRIPEVYLAQVKPGQEVAVRVDAYPGRTFAGRVYAFDSSVDAETRSIQLRARIPNPEAELRPGMFARVNLLLGKHTDAILVPEQAIVPRGKDSFVFRVVDGKAVQTRVHLGIRRAGDVEVLDGLNPDDRVVTDGQIKLRDGMAVTVLEAPRKESGESAYGS